MTEPREGLPPCVSAAVFEGRRVFMRDNRECKHEWKGRQEQIAVAVDTFIEWGPDWMHHDGTQSPSGHGPSLLELFTDDPDEAQAAFDKGAEYVRTGVLE